MIVTIVSTLDLSFIIERAEVAPCNTIDEFLHANSEYYDTNKNYNIEIQIDGVKYPKELWTCANILNAKELKIIVIPQGTLLTVVMIVGLVASVAYSIYMYNKLKNIGNTGTLASGNSIYDVNAQGNQAKYQGVIPEQFGYFKCYPSYLTDPHYYYKDNKKYMDLVMSQGIGTFKYSASGEDVMIGNTPINNFFGCKYSVINPNEKISEKSFDPNFKQIWFNSIDVTSSGKTIKESKTGVAHNATLEYQSIFFENDEDIPEGWRVGDILQLVDPLQEEGVLEYKLYPSDYSLNKWGGNIPEHWSVIDGCSQLIRLDFIQSDPIIVNDVVTSYRITRIKINFNSTWTIEDSGYWYPMSFNNGNKDMDRSQTLLAKKPALMSQNRGTINTYRFKQGAIPDKIECFFYRGSGKKINIDLKNFEIDETQQPNSHGEYAWLYINTNFTLSSDDYNTIVHSFSAHAYFYLKMTFTNTPKNYADVGEHYTDYYGDVGFYKIKKIYIAQEMLYNSYKYVTKYLLAKVNPENYDEEEEDWNCFLYGGLTPESVKFKNLIPDNEGKENIGIYRGNPVGKFGSHYELDFSAPSGIYEIDTKSGKYKKYTVVFKVLYRLVGTTKWNSRVLSFTGKNADELAFTEVFDLPFGDWEFTVVRVTGEEKDTSHSELIKWVGLKCLIGECDQYKNQTVLTIRVTGSETLSELDDNQINTYFQRKLPALDNKNNLVATSDLAPVLNYISTQSKFGNLFNLENLKEFDEFWKAQGFEFNGTFDADTTMLESMRAVANIGLSDLVVKDNELFLTKLEQKTDNEFTYIFTPQNMTDTPQVTYTLRKPDDVKQCVINYTDPNTYKTAQVIASYDKDGNLIFTDYDVSKYSEKIDTIGITNELQAQIIASRRLGYLTFTKNQYTITTELDGLNCQYNDFVGLVLNIDLQNITGRVIAQDDNANKLYLDCAIPRDTIYLYYRLIDGSPKLVNVLKVDETGKEITVSEIPQDWSNDFGSSVEYPYFAVGNVLPCWITDVQINSNSCTLTLVNYDSRVFNGDKGQLLGYGLSEYARSSYGTC